ncbi:class I SAM-dependent methyltransferase [Aquipseudomonas alcaligenes]|uniref:SAM-dependent methyltransferase n=1 Tax=Aquipseudomonas alcaligenes TaxID=43263 RepID=A0A5C7WBS7_AQUAC|nr:class I SAM-dependent methyltransferase [Pseudomonas alcaligenes]TXI34105.1 MAG: SAM-dependent methyltransferase [Pseudomonas alcaligenes]
MRLMREWWQRCCAAIHGAGAVQATQPSALQVVDPRDCGLVDAVMGGWFQNASDELFRGFSITADDVVLDLGCGHGGSTLFCARRGAHVIFTDSEAEKIEALREKVRETPARQAEGIVSNSLPLPLADNLASKVIALEVLEHVEQPLAILQELVRVGRPGAQYFISVPDRASEELQRAVAPVLHFESPNHINVFSREAFVELVENAGLIIESRDFYGFYWTLWMMLFWGTKQAEGHVFSGATHDQLEGPFHPLLNSWATLWHATINLPGGEKIRAALDQALPKTQIILARKPLICAGIP